MNPLLKVQVLAQRAFGSSARQLRNKVPEAQKLFQEDNGLPVHIKGGTADVVLYRATMALTLGGNVGATFRSHHTNSIIKCSAMKTKITTIRLQEVKGQR
uniref:Cytochrome c oxidase subunit 7A1, mitochondrial n=1 Tax=Gasterosteus aculeatus aculeatus TaxID=481459 RepID=A0AAQ4S061_GASAC